MNRRAIEHILGHMAAAEAEQNDQEYVRQLQILTHQPDEALNILHEILGEPVNDYWPAAVEVIEAIGYPRNAAVLPLIIIHAADPNSPASFGALHLLKRLAQNALESELVAAFCPM